MYHVSRSPPCGMSLPCGPQARLETPDRLMTIAEIIYNFALLDEWDDRYRYVIELGRALSPLEAHDRNEANKVQGCASQVWLATDVRPDGAGGPLLTFTGDSDAHIVRGLIAILLALYSRKGARDILATDALHLCHRIPLAAGIPAQPSDWCPASGQPRDA